jgi:hypothetical protein
VEGGTWTGVEGDLGKVLRYSGLFYWVRITRECRGGELGTCLPMMAIQDIRG